MSLGLVIVLALRRLRAWHRVAWHKLTGRWPRYRWRVKGWRRRGRRPAGLGWDGGRPCTPAEHIEFGKLAARWKRKSGLAAEPDHTRKEQR